MKLKPCKECGEMPILYKWVPFNRDNPDEIGCYEEFENGWDYLEEYDLAYMCSNHEGCGSMVVAEAPTKSEAIKVWNERQGDG